MRNVSLSGRSKFDFSALRILLSVLALSFVGMTSVAAIDNSKSLVPALPYEANLKGELLTCPVPYSTDYCTKSEWRKSCDLQSDNILQTLNLSPFMNAGTKPFCSNKLLETTQNDS